MLVFREIFWLRCDDEVKSAIRLTIFKTKSVVRRREAVETVGGS
jgi:hypothetical protein